MPPRLPRFGSNAELFAFRLPPPASNLNLNTPPRIRILIQRTMNGSPSLFIVGLAAAFILSGHPRAVFERLIRPPPTSPLAMKLPSPTLRGTPEGPFQGLKTSLLLTKCRPVMVPGGRHQHPLGKVTAHVSLHARSPSSPMPQGAHRRLDACRIKKRARTGSG